MQPPRVTIILPAYQAEAFLGATIRSVRAQTMAAFRVVVVDDGSTDGTVRAAHSAAEGDPRITVISQPNRGAGAARNAGIARAETPYLAFLDADDLWHPTLLDATLDLLDGASDLRMAFPLCHYVDETGAPTGVRSEARQARYSATDLMVDNPIHSGSGVVVRREAMAAADGFDTSLRSCIDLDCWVRVAGGARDVIGCVPEVLVDYRRRAGQITADWRRMRDGWQRTAEKAKAAGHGLTPRQHRAAQARLARTWASTAYEAGDYPTARHLVRRIWTADPAFAATDKLSLIRTAAALASYLPRGLHLRIRHAFNARA
ncbi:MAG: glycosyltransferase [Pseudomonadota bacterium]